MADEKQDPFKGSSYATRFGRRREPSTSQPVEQSTSQTVDQSDSQPAEQPTRELVKVTVYLPADAEQNFDDLWRNVQRRAGPGNKRKVTKGDLFAAALQEATKHWTEADLDQLARRMVEQSNS
jgi:hypothetical protein